MAIPSTGPVSMQDISDEFDGNSNPLSLSDYYAGGLYVPSGTTGNLGLIPSSGLITFDHFRGSENLPAFHVLSPVIILGGATGFLADIAGVPTNGNLLPQDFKGILCRAVTHSTALGGSMQIALVGQGHPQTYWTSITIGSDTILAADATFNPAGPNDDTVWGEIPFAAAPPWITGVPINLFITYP